MRVDARDRRCVVVTIDPVTLLPAGRSGAGGVRGRPLSVDVREQLSGS